MLVWKLILFLDNLKIERQASTGDHIRTLAARLAHQRSNLRATGCPRKNFLLGYDVLSCMPQSSFTYRKVLILKEEVGMVSQVLAGFEF